MIKKSILFLLVFLLIVLCGCRKQNFYEKQTSNQANFTIAESAEPDTSVQSDSMEGNPSAQEKVSVHGQNAVPAGNDLSGKTDAVDHPVTSANGEEQQSGKTDDYLWDEQLVRPEEPSVSDQPEEPSLQKPDENQDNSVVSADTGADVANIPLG